MNQVATEFDSEALIRDVIRRVAVGPDRGRDISRLEAEAVMTAILNNEIDPVQTAVFLIALRMKRESMDEFLGLFLALQKSVLQVTVRVPELLCLADPFDGYLRSIPMTPFVPAVLAACGLPSLLSGVESVGPKHGITAHKVYHLAGIDARSSTAQAAGYIEDKGWAYLDQSQYAASLYNLLGLRDRMVKRTALTTLERLLMPLRGERNTHLILGFVHKAYPEIYSTIAQQAGFASALLVKGVEGGFAAPLNKPIRHFHFKFDQPGGSNAEKQTTRLPLSMAATRAAPDNQQVGDDVVKRCLELGLEALDGCQGIARDSLVIAAAQIIYAYQGLIDTGADSLAKAVEKVQDCLDNGSAQTRFQSLIASHL